MDDYLAAEETAARDAYDRMRLDYSAPGTHRRYETWVEAHDATAARVQAGEFSTFSREWFEAVVRFVKAVELDQASAPEWTVVSRQDGQTYYAPTGVEAASREEAEEAAEHLAMMHGPTAPFWHTVTFYAVPSQAGQAYANDPDHLTVGARRWPILWAHKATYTMGETKVHTKR